MKRYITLLILIWGLAACTSTQDMPPVTIIVPTPQPQPAVIMPAHPVPVRAEAGTWVPYRDPLYHFGLVVPHAWPIFPPAPHTQQASLTLSNYQGPTPDASCPWPDGLLQLTFSSYPIAAETATTEWIEAHLGMLPPLQASTIGRYAGYLISVPDETAPEHTTHTYVTRITPDLIIQVQLAPQTAWTHPDVQSILNSLAASDEAVIFPAPSPQPPMVSPYFCQESVPLYTGPGTHFTQVGSLSTSQSYPLIGRSNDGLWVRLIHPDAPDGTAWANAAQTITTAGTLPLDIIH